MASVDVAIPCYQHGRFLRDCVLSVLDQGITDLRILIIDNASTDGSADVARQLASEDERVQVSVHAVNLGPHASFNEGVDWAAGDYFMILCSDDLLAPGALAHMVDVMERHPDAAFAYGNDTHWADGQPCPVAPIPSPAPSWHVRDGHDFITERCRKPEGYIAAGMVLNRTASHKAAGHYRPELPHTDDFEMLLRLACLGRVAHTDAVLGIKRMHGQNRTNDFLAQRTRDLCERVAALDSFFSREGSALQGSEQLLRLGQAPRRRARLLVRHQGPRTWPAQRTGTAAACCPVHPIVAVIPPFGYLSRMDRSLVDAVR